MKRRSFLKLASAALVGPTSALADTSAHVIVVGAGPAGLSAAIELAERGVQVTLLEAAGQVGGKVKGWREPLGAHSVDVEHGVHGLAEGYVHLTDLLTRYGLQGGLYHAGAGDADLLRPGDSFPLGRKRLKLLGELRRRAKRFGYPSLLGPYLKGQRWVNQLSRAKARATLSGKSVAQWFKEPNVPLTRYRLLPRVMSLSLYFVEPEDLDAGVFAISERWNGMKVRWMRGNPQILFWDPLVAAFQALGGELKTNARVHELIVEDGEVRGVWFGEPERSYDVSPPATGWVKLPSERPIFLARQQDDTLTAFDGRCTHAGCEVQPYEGGFRCPCHGGQYDRNGEVVGGPPPRPLRRGTVRPTTDKNVRVVMGGSRQQLRADAVILAVDAQTFGELAAPILPHTRGLKNTTHSVARFWFDQDVRPAACNTSLCHGVAHANNGFLLHRMQDGARRWAEQTGGSVIEIQAFQDIPADISEDDLLSAIEKDVRALWPELSAAKILKQTLVRGAEFTWFYPGWNQAGVRVDTGVSGMLAAGDHVLVDRDCEFMERAVMTGRQAANLILRQLGLPEAPVLAPIGREKRHA